MDNENELQGTPPPEGLNDYLGANVASDDPQADAAGPGARQIGNFVASEIESGPAISKAPMEGVEPESDPLTDLAGGYLGAKMGQGAAEVLGNEIGAVGNNVGRKLPAGHTHRVQSGNSPAFRHQIIDPEGYIAGFGGDKEAALADYYRVNRPNVQAGEGKGTLEFEKVTSVRPQGKLSPDAQETINKIKENRLTFFEPEKFEASFIAKDKSDEPIGHLGLDENNRTLSIKVDPRAQGQGVASTLYKKALNKTGLLRSSNIEHQLEGGQGLWEKFAEENPYHVRQARNPETLEPLRYKVWEKETNIPLRKKELDLESRIDELRDKITNREISPNIEPDARSLRLQADYTKAHDNLMKADEDLIALSQKYGIHTNQSSRGQTGIPELDEAAQNFHRWSRLKSDISKQYSQAMQAIPDPTDSLKNELKSAIKQHKAINKKSGHTLYAKGGFVSNFAEGGEVSLAGAPPPPGLDQYLESGAPQSAASSAPPEGLDDYLGELKEQKYGGALETAKAFTEGAIEGVAGPVGTAALRALGDDPEDMLARRDVHSVAHGAGQVTGLVGSTALGIGEAGLLAKAGEGVAKLAGLANATSLAGKAGALAAKAGTEMLLFTAGDEASKAILQDPAQTLPSAMMDIGLSGVMGALSGPAVGGVAALARLGAPRAVQLIEDFKGAFSKHGGNDATALEQIGAHYNEMKAAGVEVPEVFERKFTHVLDDGQRVIHEERLANALDADGNIKNVHKGDIKDFLKAGLEAENITRSPLNEVKSALGEPSYAKHVADKIADYSKGKDVAKNIGHVLGYKLGGPLGAPYVGKYLEKIFGHQIEKAIAPFGEKLLEKAANPEALNAVAKIVNAAIKGQERLVRASANLFKPGAEALSAGAFPSFTQTARLDKQVLLAQEDPEKFMDQVSNNSLGHYLPEHAQAAGAVVGNAVNYLSAIRPKKEPTSPLDSPHPPTSAQQAQYQNALTIAQQPMVILHKVQNGTITVDDIKHLNAMYPQAYSQMTSQVAQAMTDHLSKGHKVPYKTRIGLSLFTGQPLDSTFKPQAILSAQPHGGQPQAPTSGPKQGGKHSLKGLPKLASASMTPLQARSQREMKD